MKIKENHDIAVLEMGISDFNEMNVLSKIAKPDVCVITNIGLLCLIAFIYQKICSAYNMQVDVSYLWLSVTAVVLTLASIAGDLIASVIKRQIGIKDYGKLIPGHGGIMDRFDSILLTAPALYVMSSFVKFIN